MRLLTALIQWRYENRKAKRVIDTLKLEVERLNLDPSNKQLARYIGQLVKYLERA